MTQVAATQRSAVQVVAEGTAERERSLPERSLPDAVHPAYRAAIRRLTLTNFRSYDFLDLALDGRPVALAGANGAGKTNILESVSLIGPGRGLRGGRLADYPRHGGSGGWSVAVRLEASDDERRLGVGAEAHQPDKRVCRIDGRSASGPIAFADHVRFLWLTPAQDRLFMEGAGERRKFLDRMTQAHDPTHARAANTYETAMRQRQKLLENDLGTDDAWLSSLEMQMAEAGVAVAAARREMAALLAEHNLSDDGGQGAVFPAADIALQGDIESMLDEAPAATVEDTFADRLRANRRLDAEAKRATLGPHRSDLLVTHRAKSEPARLCSTGEQKALLIGLVLANACTLAKRQDCPPLILLLDEIAAHLDPARRAALFDILDTTKFQCFMTGTDHQLFEAWGERAQLFTVCDGVLTEAR
ncbi:MAG: DNA replication/repair protein RecF [Pseudomonadota bacterium]